MSLAFCCLPPCSLSLPPSLRLRDSSPLVRKNTIVVLTHLILNDMVKVKGQISELALSLEDSERGIADLARLFFLELSKKVCGRDLLAPLFGVIWASLSKPQTVSICTLLIYMSVCLSVV